METADDTGLALRRTAEIYAENGFAPQAVAQYDRLIRHLRQRGDSEAPSKTELTRALTEAFSFSYECGSWRDAYRFGKELASLLAAELEDRPSTLVRRAYADSCKKYQDVCLARLRYISAFRLMARERKVAKHLYARTGEENFHSSFREKGVIMGLLLVVSTLIVVMVTLLVIAQPPWWFICLFLAAVVLCLSGIGAAGKLCQRRTQKEWEKKWNT